MVNFLVPERTTASEKTEDDEENAMEDWYDDILQSVNHHVDMEVGPHRLLEADPELRLKLVVLPDCVGPSQCGQDDHANGLEER